MPTPPLADALVRQHSAAATAAPCPDTIEVPPDFSGLVRQGDLYFYRIRDVSGVTTSGAPVSLGPGVSVPLCEGSHLLSAPAGTATPGLPVPTEYTPSEASADALAAIAGHLLHLPEGGIVPHADHPDVRLPGGTWGTFRQLDLATQRAVLD